MSDRVLIRKWRESGSLIAILPDCEANYGRTMMYGRIGQHCEGDYAGVVAQSDPVLDWTDPQAVSLLSELKSLGYNPVFTRRLHRRHKEWYG